MIRIWTGVALLAGSWLFGLHYYQPVSWAPWSVATVLGAVLLAGTPLPLPPRRHAMWAAVLLVPAVWFLPWPYRAIPVALIVGILLWQLPFPGRWPAQLGRGTIAAGAVLLAQSLCLLGYAHRLARTHELPWALAKLAGGIAWLLGAEVTMTPGSLVIRSAREVHRLGTTWELVLDPVTLGFLVGGLVWLALAVVGREAGNRWSTWLRLAGRLTLLVALWLPVRMGLMVGLLLNRVVIADAMAPLTVMEQFLSPWVNLALLAGPVLLAWRLVPIVDAAGRAASDAAVAIDFDAPPDANAPAGRARQVGPAGPAWRYSAAAALAVAALAMITVALCWEPVGQRKGGRVMVVERHSTWEPTDRPYDTSLYGERGSYTYSAIYDYCTRFYEMSRLEESDQIDDPTLAKCDVLIVKIPTSAFLPEEVEAIGRFVEQGGSLLTIGDHTNVFKSTSYLNPIVRPMGFIFRHDLLFSIGEAYREPYQPGRLAHPVVQRVPRMEFAVPCSIDPGNSCGRPVIQKAGLWSLMPDYNASNFHPNAAYQTDMRYGPFIQIWAATHGAGRVVAFADSTIFSNFCVFEPGKTEIFMGMLEWLNRRSPLDRAWLRGTLTAGLVTAGLVLLAVSLVWTARLGGAWLLLAACGLLGFSGTGMLIEQIHWHAMPPAPQLDSARPVLRVVIDRTVSEAKLARDGFTDDSGKGYGLVEQWIPRLTTPNLAYYSSRASGLEVFSGEPQQSMVVVLCPSRPVSDEYRNRLIDFVAKGGKLLVVDSPDVEYSTANSLLWPFGLSSQRTATKGSLRTAASSWPRIDVEAACEIRGGEPLVWVDKTAVAAKVQHGKGQVTAIGFGMVFQDDRMGYHWMTLPDPPLLNRFEFLYTLVRAAAEGQAVKEPSAQAEEPTAPKLRRLPIIRRPGALK